MSGFLSAYIVGNLCGYPGRLDSSQCLINVVAAIAGFDTQDEISSSAMGLRHYVPVYAMALSSGFCAARRARKFEGFFSDVHATFLTFPN